MPKAGAGTYAIQLSELREATADEKLLHEARVLHHKSLRLNDAGKSDKAIDLANRALVTREKILGSGHPDVAASLLALGASYWSKGDHTRAEDVLQRAMAATTKISGTETLDYADVYE
jgi:tetratricopeptide (TPR) repeat protein